MTSPSDQLAFQGEVRALNQLGNGEVKMVVYFKEQDFAQLAAMCPVHRLIAVAALQDGPDA